MILPSSGEIVSQLLGKAGMVEDHMSAGCLRLQLKLRNRVNAYGLLEDAPRLKDSLVGTQFDVTADEVSANNEKAPPKLEKRNRPFARGRLDAILSTRPSYFRFFAVATKAIPMIRSGIEIHIVPKSATLFRFSTAKSAAATSKRIPIKR